MSYMEKFKLNSERMRENGNLCNLNSNKACQTSTTIDVLQESSGSHRQMGSSFSDKDFVLQNTCKCYKRNTIKSVNQYVKTTKFEKALITELARWAG